jgi:transposase
LPGCISPGVNKKSSVTIWGCITFNGVGTICRVYGNINSAKYIDILENNLWPVVARHFADGDYLFMNDNAPVHRSHVTHNYKNTNQIPTLDWPAQSTDLNPIENVWLTIKRKVQRRTQTINTVSELYDNIFDIWTSFTVEYIQALYMLVPDRVKRVQRARGYITKY